MLFNVFRTPSPLPATAWRGPESLPRTPVPARDHGPPPAPVYSYPLQYEDHRSFVLSPSSTRTDDTVDESIGSQVSKLYLLLIYVYKRQTVTNTELCFLKN